MKCHNGFFDIYRKKKYESFLVEGMIFHVIKNEQWLYIVLTNGFKVAGGRSNDYCAGKPSLKQLGSFVENYSSTLKRAYISNPEGFRVQYNECLNRVREEKENS